MEKVIITYKRIGETPLECLERVRKEKNISINTPMTYAGRLDPMAEGELILIIDDECKNKEKYLAFDKEYEVDVLFGISTDTYDILGIIDNICTNKKDIHKIELNKYIGKFIQEYPPYSSKTVNGKQLHNYAREGEILKEIPSREVEIYSIENLGIRNISVEEILKQIKEKISIVKGDFRQEEIIMKWEKTLSEDLSESIFHILKIKVKCSSGTYMRSLAKNIGKDIGDCSLAFSIKRLFLFPNKR